MEVERKENVSSLAQRAELSHEVGELRVALMSADAVPQARDSELVASLRREIETMRDTLKESTMRLTSACAGEAQAMKQGDEARREATCMETRMHLAESRL